MADRDVAAPLAARFDMGVDDDEGKSRDAGDSPGLQYAAQPEFPGPARASTGVVGGRYPGTLKADAGASTWAGEAADPELLRNFGEHAIMGRVQAALERQLRAAIDRVEAQLREQVRTFNYQNRRSSWYSTDSVWQS